MGFIKHILGFAKGGVYESNGITMLMGEKLIKPNGDILEFTGKTIVCREDI